MDVFSLIIISLLVVALSVVLLGIRVFFVKGGVFPSSHVEDQPILKAKGMSCHTSQHIEAVRHKNLFELLGEKD
ncbi:MAG: hypothetical protein SOW44_00350 [Porphyromonas sp.]|nr:hypothetical protein [Bacteroidales bacterium]MDD7558705.1 hypothetical protein [Bacteroidales bacterium]MDY3099784.1 hypothetical protein [Porphyromonas sp.]